MPNGKFKHNKNLFFIQCVQSLVMLCLFFLYESATAQTLNRAEYFFDNDPGTGNAIPVTITPGASVNFTFAANISTLTNGFHNLNFRIRDNTGKWSHFQSRTFYIVSNAALATSSSITRAEYFFDNDPGKGNGTSVSVTPGLTINQNVAIPITSLTPGFHNLNFRTVDNRGQWSHFATRTFYIVPPIIGSAGSSIQKAEYFFDSDPGVGKGVNIPVTSASSINQNVAIPITSLAPGFHNLNFRTRDDQGRWSHFATRTFYIVPPLINNTPLTLQKAEYFFDNDPGTGLAKALPITSGSFQNNVFALDISALTQGFHRLGIRYQDNRGQWSHFAVRTFYLIPGNALPASSLAKIEYFIDTDPGIGKATDLSITPGTAIDKLYAIDLTGVPSGAHNLSVRAKDSNGFWSVVFTSPFTLLNCTPPTAPVALSVERCGTGSVTFNASGGTGSQVYRWYADATTKAILAVAPFYKTDSLLATRNYFVSVYDPLTFCESNRTQVSATILILPKPVLNLTGSLSVCDGNAIVLRGPSGFTTYTWSNGLTSQEITVTTSGIFSLKVNDGKCTSPASDPFTFTVQPKPAAPIIQPGAGSSLLLCAKSPVTLVGSGASGTQVYRWYTDATTTTTLSVGTSYTTDSLTATRKYFVAVYDPSTLCESLRTELTINVTIIPKPTLNLTGPLTICDGNSVVLRAPTGFKNYLWSNGLTTSEITVITTGNYTVKVGDGTCTSPVSNTFALTVEQKPAKPVIQITGSTTLCGSETRTIAAPLGFKRYLWSKGDTTRQITVSASGDYTVKVFNSSGCESPISAPITFTSFVSPAKPIIQTVGSPVLCNTNTSVTLRAPFGFTIYQWSNGAITQEISASSAGKYSVVTGNHVSCLSASSDVISVTDQQGPCRTSGSPDPNNRAPVIVHTIGKGSINGIVFIPLANLITDLDNNLDLSTLKITNPPQSGAIGSIDNNYNLTIDYTGINFAGAEDLTIQVCDFSGSCTQQQISMEVAGDILAYNALSPNGDGKNEVLYLEYIDVIPETMNNLVTIYNRWGNSVFEITNYNNIDRVFAGLDKDGKELSNGIYYYKIQFNSGKEPKIGYITLRR